MGTTYRVAVIGGTGPQGRGLAWRFASQGYAVTLGSRTAARAHLAAAELSRRLEARAASPEAQIAGVVQGATNEAACVDADVVVLAVPWAGHDELIAQLSLRDQILVSCVNPLRFDAAGPVGIPVDGGLSSAAEHAQALAPQARVVGAFHHVSAVSLLSEVDYLDHEDVLICGDDAAAKDVVAELARCVTGRPGLDAGPLRMARHLEPLTAVLISINKLHKCRSGLRIAGVRPPLP